MQNESFLQQLLTQLEFQYDTLSGLTVVVTLSRICIRNGDSIMVILDQFEVGSGKIRDLWEKHRRLGILGCILVQIQSDQSIIPKVKQLMNLKRSQSCTRNHTLRHKRRVVLRDFPFAILIDVNKSVSSLDLGTIDTHGEVVHSSILSPVCFDQNISPKSGLGAYGFMKLSK